MTAAAAPSPVGQQSSRFEHSTTAVRLHDVVEGDRVAVLRLRVEWTPLRAFFTATAGDLLAGGAVGLHVSARRHRVVGRRGEPLFALQRHPVGGQGATLALATGHLLHADDEGDVVLAARHGHVGEVERHRTRGAERLLVEDGHALDAEFPADQLADAALARRAVCRCARTRRRSARRLGTGRRRRRAQRRSRRGRGSPAWRRGTCRRR